MGKKYDFKVRYNPEKDTIQDLTNRILYAIWVKPLKANKPRVIFLGGDSGEGKSHTAVYVLRRLLEMQGAYTGLSDIDATNVFNPVEYGDKLLKLLNDKQYKKLNVFCVHEGRQVIRAKHWHSLVNQSIGDVNALSRAIKRICFILISQFIRDIDNDVRYTLNYYCKVERPNRGNAKLYINVVWKDDKDLEKPRLMKRRLRGYLIMPNGSYRPYSPAYMEIEKLDKETAEYFDLKDFESKQHVIKNRITALMTQLKIEQGLNNTKIPAMLKVWTENLDQVKMLGKMYRGKWRLYDHVKVSHGLSDDEANEFSEKLLIELKNKGYFGEKEDGENL